MYSVDSGSLDRSVSLLRAVVSRDEMNAEQKTWPVFATVRASRVDLSDSERVRAAQVGSSVTTRFVIRWSRRVFDLNPRDQLQCEGRLYDIVHVKELGRRVALEITANAHTDGG